MSTYPTCDPTCTTDCGHCKGNHEQARLGQIRARARIGWFPTAAETVLLLDLLDEKDATIQRVRELVQPPHRIAGFDYYVPKTVVRAALDGQEGR